MTELREKVAEIVGSEMAASDRAYRIPEEVADRILDLPEIKEALELLRAAEVAATLAKHQSGGSLAERCAALLGPRDDR